MRTLLPAVAALLLTAPANAQELTAEEVKRLALEAIRENPEIVMEAVEALRRAEEDARAEAAAALLDEGRGRFEEGAPVMGNPEGDVAMVEFFDYNCPYCRRAKPEIEAALAQDGAIRLVAREWPILGEGSVFAARAALAAREQGLYEPFHWALMGMTERAEEESVLRVAAEVGLDVERLRRDMEAPGIEAHIAESMRLADELGFSGTPSFVIGDTLVPGFVEADALLEAVEAARASGE